MTVSSIFKNKKVNFSKLSDFGFYRDGDDFVYSESVIEGMFRMDVRILSDGTLKARVIDVDNDDEYVLHLTNDAVGAFVGKVRTAYNNILQKIADRCFDVCVFSGSQTQKVIQYIRQKYQNEFEFLWEKSPENAIVRRTDNKKWYAAILTVARSKIQPQALIDEPVEIIDLRGVPEKIPALTDGKSFFPGYHMNKKHWFTIILDGSASFEEICAGIDESYLLAKK